MTTRRRRPVLRLLAVASSFRDLLEPLKCRNGRELIALVQAAVGEGFEVRGNTAQIEAVEDDQRGGRQDDDARIREIQRTLADDDVAAIVALRGGAWLTRILRHVDFTVLGRRRNRLAIFGFSELTPFINVAAAYRQVFAYHDLCPGFLLAGLKRHARVHHAELGGGVEASGDRLNAFASDWARQRFRAEFEAFFADVVSILEGRGSARSLVGRVVVAPVPTVPVSVVGGNLTTLTTLWGSPHRRVLRPTGRWLLLEDTRETPDRIDRLLSLVNGSGWLQRYAGLLVGRFVAGEQDYTAAALACLVKHLRPAPVPVVALENVGHVWPLAPVPLRRRFHLRVTGRAAKGASVSADCPWKSWRIVNTT